MKWYEIMAANDLLDNTTGRLGLDCAPKTVCVCVCVCPLHSIWSSFINIYIVVLLRRPKAHPASRWGSYQVRIQSRIGVQVRLSIAITSLMSRHVY